MKKMKTIYTDCENCSHKIVCKMVNKPRILAQEYEIDTIGTKEDNDITVEFTCNYFEQAQKFNLR